MKVEEPVDGTLIVTYDSSGLTKLMLTVMALILGVAAYDLLVGTRGTDRLVGLLASAGTCLSIGIVFLETTWFEFAGATRLITWRRRWALRERSGTLPFAAVQSVLIETPMGDDGTPSRRISLRTKDGVGIPITVGYRPDPDRTVLQIATRIRTLLGHDSEETGTTDAKALVGAGRIIDAIRVLRQEEGLSLVEAKKRVDELARRSK